MGFNSSQNNFKLPSSHLVGNVKVADKSWRNARSLSGLHDGGQNVTKSLLRSDITIEDSSCICVNNQQNYIVQAGVGGRFQTIKVIQKSRSDAKQFTNTTTVLDKKDSPIPNTNIFSPQFSGKFPGPIHCMDMLNQYLLIGSSNGECYVKTMDVASEKNNCLLDDSPNSIVKCQTFSHSKLKKSDQSSILTTPSPEQYTFSTKINNVQIERSENPKNFHTLENNRLHIWSFEKDDAPIQTIQGSRSPLWCSSWSSFNSNLILIGGVSKAVKLIDTRSMGIANANIQFSHCDAITDVQWSPLLPYWFASCSTDGLIYVWDQRYAAEPIKILEGHNNVVKKISWSRSHVEVLASGGVDHSVKLWSLRTEPHHVLTTLDKGFFSDSILGLSFSNVTPNQLFANSASGELLAISVGSQVLDPLVQHRFFEEGSESSGKKDSEKDNIENVETNIFHRNLTQAFSDVEQIATKLKNQNKLEKALKLLELCKPKINTGTEKANTNPKARFKKELEDYSYHIPPNFSLAKKPDEKRIDDLILNCKILRFVQRKEFSEIVSLESKLLELLKSDTQRIELGTIRDVIKLYLAHDYKKGMSLAIEIAYILKDQFEEYQKIVKEIINPSIYEVSHNQSLRESGYRSLAKAFQNQEYIIEQLKLQKDVIGALWGYSDSSKMIINYVGDTYLDIISASVLRTYLNALLCQQQYDKFFIVCTKLLQKIQAIPSYMTGVLELALQKIYDIYEFSFAQLVDSAQKPLAKKFAEELLKRFELRKLAAKSDDLTEIQEKVADLVPILENVYNEE
ncbi:predicted protein [Naegleria gruberi]|uniref:Predicted protein n=1 Tax=Naegleria gruberi TaxID=5762 RepID=D2V0N5_NAEGR|nr:uncharacterized protein NAEGRDRAFT_45735 [Naegleria gruberi]EFC49551.1 predicted protein [Naegleria gruberi]|eukprot:XP_002682295.1 predicted protein [Naegleria gruberi strain NEG-M]